jgi:hypothetical protein
MDHEAAASTHAIERYLLGEMPVAERDEFEDHFFTCTVCAEGIRFASDTTGDIKAVLRDLRSAPEPVPWWRSLFRVSALVPVYACAMTVAVGYTYMAVLPELRAPRAMGAAIIMDGRTRGNGPMLKTGDPLHFLTGVDGVDAPRLWVELTSSSGTMVRGGEVSTPVPDRPLDVYFPGSLTAGRYQLVVRDRKGGKELSRSAFDVHD